MRRRRHLFSTGFLPVILIPIALVLIVLSMAAGGPPGGGPPGGGGGGFPGGGGGYSGAIGPVGVPSSWGNSYVAPGSQIGWNANQWSMTMEPYIYSSYPSVQGTFYGGAYGSFTPNSWEGSNVVYARDYATSRMLPSWQSSWAPQQRVEFLPGSQVYDNGGWRPFNGFSGMQQGYFSVPYGFESGGTLYPMQSQWWP